MKKVQEKFLEKLAFNHINTLHRQYKITEEKIKELSKPFLDKKVEYDSNLVKGAMEKDGIDTEGIYHTLISIDVELDEDLSFKTKAFLDIFRVFDVSYTYLED